MASLTQDENGNHLWTVLLLRPDYVASNYGQDTWLTHVAGETVKEAQAAARAEAAAADYAHPDDYFPLFACRGHLNNLADPDA